MKRLKKMLALLLTLVMVLSLAACGGGKDTPKKDTGSDSGNGGQQVQEEEGNDDIQKLTDKDTLVVGAADLNGDYINGFGNSSYDVAIKMLIGTYDQDLGYNTYYYDQNGEYHVNPTVVNGDPEVTTNEDGSKTYTFKINDNLVWNDGTPITAKDYVFTLLFHSSPEWTKTGSNNGSTAEDLVGFKEYHDGTTRTFKGVELVDDSTFKLTISADIIPYFYETTKVAYSPSPLHRYAPNLDVKGSELVVKDGYEITEEDKNNLVKSQEEKVNVQQKEFDDNYQDMKDNPDDYGIKDGQLEEFDKVLNGDYKAYYEERTAEGYDGEPIDGNLSDLIQLKLKVDEEQALLDGYKDGSIELSPLELLLVAATNDIAFNYRFSPDVTCGPYNFVENKNNMAKVTINDKFVGDYKGDKPKIKNVVVQTVQSKLDVDLVISGTIDLAWGVIEGDKINKAKENEDKVGFSHYFRNGYGVMPILCDVGATQYKGVRQAIAFSLDRDEFVQTIAEGYGTTVDAGYGVDQWEYVELADKLAENMVHYTRNEDSANKALDTTPYIYEKDGKTPWDAKKAIDAYNKDKDNFDYWRYDDKGKQLRVIHEGTQDLNVSELIQNQLPDQSKKVGLQYIFNPVNFATMLNHMYFPDMNNPDAPSVFNLGTNFSIPNDPYYQYHSSQIGADNTYRVNDPEIDAIIEKMRKADPTDRETWVNGFYDFVMWYNDYMPAVPLYGNDYHDIYTNRVKGLETTPFWQWYDIICDLSIEE